MFQSFSASTHSGNLAMRLESLRATMRREGLDWYLVPHADEQQNEYLPACAERLAWLTGFTGSAGFALVGLEQAYLFIDGRYTLQAASQTDSECWSLKDLIGEPPVRFAQNIVGPGSVIGYDAMLLTIAQEKAWRKLAGQTGSQIRDVDNLVDGIWSGRPAAPLGQAWLHPLRFSGKAAGEKLSELRQKLQADKVDYLLMTDPASVAWTFNLRGSDVAHNPLALAHAIVPLDESLKPVVFIDRRKLDASHESDLEAVADLLAPSKMESWLAEYGDGRMFACDPNLVSSGLAGVIEKAGGTVLEITDPVSLLRAVKNATELEGARSAQLRDNVAVCRFLAWLSRQQPATIDEISAAKALEEYRRQTASEMGSELREISFDTISGAGANGAIIHYRVNEETNAVLSANTLYLVDSGGQYEDGTTDITRTVAIGTPPKEAIRDYTLVLKGHIAIAAARFPEGTRGIDLDPFARQALWQAGKDFAHGTGHGIGSYLNVHEGPQSISKRGMQPLLSGMIISNEPGYYREGHYGIRLENLVVVSEATGIAGGDRPMLSFETITLCPFDRRLVDASLLSPGEIRWLNEYHARTCEMLSPHLASGDLAWLQEATAPLPE